MATSAVLRAMTVLLGVWLAGSASFASRATERLDLPPRPENALTGSAFKTEIENLSRVEREQRVFEEFCRGNVPDFLREFQPVTVQRTIGGEPVEATYYVAPDYVAIGNNEDFFRMPTSAPLAQQLADVAGCSLPTRRMVDAIYSTAPIKLSPNPFSPSEYQIDTVPVFWLNHQAIEAQRSSYDLGPIVAGIKKDIVITPKLPLQSGSPKVAIYGWHQLNGQPIQPLYLGHVNWYHDYSHGVRLVGNWMKVDSRLMAVSEVLAHPDYAELLSDEGAFGASRYPMADPYELTGQAANTLQNGDFEGSFVGGVATGWNAWSTQSSAAINFGRATINRVDGSASQYWSRSGTDPIDGGVYQRVAVEPGAHYRILALLKRQSDFEGTFVRFGVALDGTTDPESDSVDWTALAATGDDYWAIYREDVQARGEWITLVARCGHTGTTGDTSAYFYLDSAILTRLETDTP